MCSTLHLMCTANYILLILSVHRVLDKWKCMSPDNKEVHFLKIKRSYNANVSYFLLFLYVWCIYLLRKRRQKESIYKVNILITLTSGLIIYECIRKFFINWNRRYNDPMAERTLLIISLNCLKSTWSEKHSCYVFLFTKIYI